MAQHEIVSHGKRPSKPFTIQRPVEYVTTPDIGINNNNDISLPSPDADENKSFHKTRKSPVSNEGSPPLSPYSPFNLSDDNDRHGHGYGHDQGPPLAQSTREHKKKKSKKKNIKYLKMNQVYPTPKLNQIVEKLLLVLLFMVDMLYLIELKLKKGLLH